MNVRPTDLRIAVITADWTGHRLTYIAAVAELATKRGVDLKIVVDEQALVSDEWATLMPDLGNHVVVAEDWSGPTFPILKRVAADVDHMIVMEADHLLDDILRLLVTNRHVSVTNQLMREPRNPVAGGLSPVERGVALAKPPLLTLLGQGFRSRCQNKLLVSPLFAPGVIARALIAMGAVERLVDPVLIEGLDRPASAGAQATHRSVTDGVAVIGKLDERKSTDVLARAWADPAMHHIALRLCGATDAGSDVGGLVERATQAGATIEFADRFVADTEIDTAIADSVAVICAYTGDIPSGVAALALAGGCPVIAFAGTRLGHAVQHHQLGVAVHDLYPATLLAAIEQAAALDRSQIQRKAADLHRDASPAVFARELLPQVG